MATKTGSPPTGGEPMTIAIDSIATLPDHNPRTTDDPERVAQLVDSVRRHGLLQPVLVVPATDGDGYVLVAGHRRLAAAREAGLRDVPALVREPDHGQLLGWAVIENLQRVDLNPVDEATAYEKALKATPRMTHKRLAEQIGVSAGHVSERLRLLRLPEAVRGHIAAGLLPTRLATMIEQLAKVSKPVAIACANAVARGKVEAQQFERTPERVLSHLHALLDDADDVPVIIEVSSWQSHALEDLPLPPEAAEEIANRAQALGVEWIRITDEDADAAKAYGCLIELRHKDDPHHRHAFITDPQFVADRVRLALDRAEERADQASGPEAQREGADPTGDALDGAASADPADVRRAERERDRAESRSARIANAELGARLAEAFHAPTVTTDAVRVLALLAIEHHADALACRGLRYLREDWQSREARTLKSGQTRERIDYPGRAESTTRLYDWLASATTPEEVLGRALQAVIAARFADDQAVPRSQRIPWETPGANGEGGATTIPSLLDALAAPHLPERIARLARERRDREQRWRRVGEGGEEEGHDAHGDAPPADVGEDTASEDEHSVDDADASESDD